ncbi:hypothetical protein [Pseudomonas koreensis]|uniref:hypothetical protein n=1 Tax=Pseudomonas koreensis TaxID=198620 RepID=UPI00382FEE9B
MDNMMQAEISYFGVDFVGDSEFAIRDMKTWFKVSARDVLGETGSHYLDFYIPASVINDGTEQTLLLLADPDGTPGQARAEYSRFISGGATTYVSSSGTLTLRYDWKLARMQGEFEYAFRPGGENSRVEHGSFEITGISDGLLGEAEFKRVAITAADTESSVKASGTFKAYSPQWGNFDAKMVSKELKEFFPGDRRYWELVGRRNDVPTELSQIAVFFFDYVPAGEHKLKDNDNVWIIYVRHGVIHHATDGTLIINSHPEGGSATGTLLAIFPDGGEDVIVNGEFDIRD